MRLTRVSPAQGATGPAKGGLLAIRKDSSSLLVWKVLLRTGTAYSCLYSPFATAFDAHEWALDTPFRAMSYILDVLFTADVGVTCFTSMVIRGYEVQDLRRIRKAYFRSWLLIDVLSGPPWDMVLIGMAGESAWIRWVGCFLRLLRLSRFYRVMRITGASFLRVAQSLLAYVLLAHWAGLLWYSIAIKPYRSEIEAAYPDDMEWYWQKRTANDVGNIYVCTLTWALTVVTNLKGVPTNEARLCFHPSETTQAPLAERSFTLLVFVGGALFFAVFYSNMLGLVTSLYEKTQLHRRRLAATQEFASFHGISAGVTNRAITNLTFVYETSKGINVKDITRDLPVQLVLEIRCQMYEKLVRRVNIFTGCGDAFFHAAVMKLHSAVCLADEYVFRDGEAGDNMFFIERGILSVVKGDKVVHTFQEGGYFGEIALLYDGPRTASVRALTNCLLLSLSLADLAQIFEVAPAAREIIEGVAQERLNALQQMAQGVPQPRPSGRISRGSHSKEAPREVKCVAPSSMPPSSTASGTTATTATTASPNGSVPSSPAVKRRPSFSGVARRPSESDIANPSPEGLRKSNGQSPGGRRPSLDRSPSVLASLQAAESGQKPKGAALANLRLSQGGNGKKEELRDSDADSNDGRRGMSDEATAAALERMDRWFHSIEEEREQTRRMLVQLSDKVDALAAPH